MSNLVLLQPTYIQSKAKNSSQTENTSAFWGGDETTYSSLMCEIKAWPLMVKAWSFHFYVLHNLATQYATVR